jgi:CheY-like chemotaxis protein
MDIGLGQGMNGYECAKRIRQREAGARTRTPIIALTYRADVADHDSALDAGMDDFMSKPFDPEDLRKMLLRHVYVPEAPNLRVLSPAPKEEFEQLAVDF